MPGDAKIRVGVVDVRDSGWKKTEASSRGVLLEEEHGVSVCDIPLWSEWLWRHKSRLTMVSWETNERRVRFTFSTVVMSKYVYVARVFWSQG